MSAVIRSLCCCNGQRSDDEDPLMNDTDDDHFRTTGPSDGNDRFWADNVDANGEFHGTTNVSAGNFRQNDEEEELLNQILETTQQNIIDVANMDGSTTPCKEDLSKAQRYSDAIRQHDLRVRKDYPSTTSRDDVCVLCDVGSRAVELLQQSVQPLAVHSELRNFAKNMSEAMVNGIKIEHKEEILVHMSFPDEE